MRVRRLQEAMVERRNDIFIIQDPDSLYYFSGYQGYLGMDYGRPTLLVVPADREPVLITPEMEAEMAAAMTWIDDIQAWMDGRGREWIDSLVPQLAGAHRVAIEERKTHPVVAAGIREFAAPAEVSDAGELIQRMRMIKDVKEIEDMRKAGMVGTAMMTAARDALGEGVPEYELWLAASAAGSRKAAELMVEDNGATLISPLIHGLPPVQSGRDTAMAHRRASTRRLQRGDSVYFCFCGLVSFRMAKLGFDRQFFVGEARDEYVDMLEGAYAAQRAALEAVRPGVLAEEVHFAADQAYRNAGFAPSYRTGRGTGISSLELPELKAGDKTPLEPGMTLVIDGGVTVAGRGGGRVGDSIVVTETGFEFLTGFQKGVMVI